MKRLWVMGLVGLILVGLSYAQELACGKRPKKQSQKIPQEMIKKYGNVPDRILVEFKPGVIKLPRGVYGGPPDSITITSPRVKTLCDSLGVVKIERSFKNAIPGDTLKISRTGKLVKVSDLSRWFDIYFSDSVNVKSVVKLNFVKKSEQMSYKPRNIAAGSVASLASVF